MTTCTRRVVVLDEGYGSHDIEQAILAEVGAEVVPSYCRGDAAAVGRAMAGADAAIVRESPIDAAAIAGVGANFKVIVRSGVGVDNIDRAAAAARRIYVANVPDYGVDDVSDHALALLLAVARRIPSRDRATRQGAWNVARAEPMYRLRGQVLGLVGYGRIGQAFHHKAAALGFARVLVHDPVLTAPPEGTALVPLDQLLAEADVVSLHAPLLPATRHLLGAPQLARMKPTAVLVNTSRGGLVDEAALVAALRERRLFGAGLDVYEQEPPARDNPLFALDNAVLTDHTAWYSEGSVVDLQRKAAEEVARVLRGELPRSWVNRWPGAAP
ncbi:MAG: C-terminal binding protein [Anaeromyxobacter sp.]